MTTNLYRLTIEDIFGVGATQDIHTLVIQKSSMQGLTPATTNTAEAILVAVIATALPLFSGNIVTESGQLLATDDDQVLSFDNSEAFELLKVTKWNTFQFSRNQQAYIKNQVIINGYSAD